LLFSLFFLLPGIEVPESVTKLKITTNFLL